MSAEELVPSSAEASAPAPALAPSNPPEAPTDNAPPPTDAEAPAEPSKPSSSPNRKIARPARAQSAMAGGSSKKGANGSGGGESKLFGMGDIVLSRLKGYPFWPSRITDPKGASDEVRKSRPSTKPYIHLVEFFPEGNFGWINSSQIKALPASEIETFLSQPNRKASSLLKEAYETAQDPTEWDAQQADIRKQKEEALAAAQEGYDELEDEDDAPAGGKRKRATEKKPKSKKAKTAKKSAADVESEEGAGKAKKGAAAKPATKAPDSKPADDDPMSSDPECIRVKDWRHRLQRAFLGKGLPESSEMSTYDDLFKTIESYKDMTIEALQYSKIGKVMKKIAVLEGIPRNADFKITDRASKLMHEWQEYIDKKGGGDTNGHAEANGTETKSAPTTSGPAPGLPEESKAEESRPEESTAMDTDPAPAADAAAAPAPAAEHADDTQAIPKPEAAELPTPIYPPVNGQ